MPGYRDPLPVAIAAAALGLAYIAISRRRNRNRAPLPPGPPGIPIAGNLPDVPSEKEWLTYTKWRETYGTYASDSI
jgi:hypothetical protein